MHISINSNYDSINTWYLCTLIIRLEDNKSCEESPTVAGHRLWGRRPELELNITLWSVVFTALVLHDIVFWDMTKRWSETFQNTLVSPSCPVARNKRSPCQFCEVQYSIFLFTDLSFTVLSSCATACFAQRIQPTLYVCVVWIPTGTSDFSLLRNVQAGSGTQPAIYLERARVISREVQRPGSETDRLPPFSAEVNNEWNCTFARKRKNILEAKDDM